MTQLRRRTKDDILRQTEIHGHKINIYWLRIETGEYFEIPSFLVRNQKLKGWQVRIARIDVGYHSEYYPDENRSPEKSLAEACCALRRILEGVDHRKRSGFSKTERKKKLRTGIPGVAYKWNLNKKTGIYNLRIEVRAGFGSRRDNKSIVCIFVGTELTVTEERIRAKLHKAAGMRRRRVEHLIRTHNEVQQKRGRRTKGFHIPLDEIEASLQAHKERNVDQLSAVVSEKVELGMKGPEHLQSWCGTSFKRKSVLLKGEELRVPEFVDLDDETWMYEIKLPDGALYGDSIPVSGDFEADMKEILFDCMFEAAMASKAIPRETVYDDADVPMHSKLPLSVIERLNTQQ